MIYDIWNVGGLINHTRPVASGNDLLIVVVYANVVPLSTDVCSRCDSTHALEVFRLREFNRRRCVYSIMRRGYARSHIHRPINRARKFILHRFIDEGFIPCGNVNVKIDEVQQIRLF